MARKVLIIIAVVCFLFINFPQVTKADVVPTIAVKKLIVKHAKEMGIDPAIALSIAKIESGFCQSKKSRYGAVGVFQLMPNTAKKMGYNPYSIHDNIKGGIAYYKKMYKMFGSMELALAAYNAGPGNVKKYNGIPPFKETKKFISSIKTNYNHFKTSPESSMDTYKNIKDINYFVKDEDEEIAANDFRMQQDAILKEFLSVQGI